MDAPRLAIMQTHESNCLILLLGFELDEANGIKKFKFNFMDNYEAFGPVNLTVHGNDITWGLENKDEIVSFPLHMDIHQLASFLELVALGRIVNYVIDFYDLDPNLSYVELLNNMKK